MRLTQDDEMVHTLAPDSYLKLGNGSTVFALHTKGVAAIALRNRYRAGPSRSANDCRRTRTSHQ